MSVTLQEAHRRVRYRAAIVLIEIGKAIQALGAKVAAAGVEITRLGAYMRKANQELPK